MAATAAPTRTKRRSAWDGARRIPPVAAAAVERGRLTALLEDGIARPVTLVAGPAGGGKTILMADWARQHAAHGRVSWVTLGRAEVTLRGLWTALAATLGAGALGAHAPETPEELAGRVVASLGRARRPVVLVLDDVHEADGQPLAAFVHALVAAPSALRLVLGTRIDPGLALQRLRINDQLSEVRSRDLAFTTAEAAQLFEREGVALTREQVERLVDRTEGWAAGLRLAALMLTDEDEPETAVAEFTGDDRAVVSYLIQEVLDRQPDAMRELLLRTAVVDRVCGPLADALTGDIGGQTLLEELLRRNAFVVPLDRHGRWFRYHALFADLLRSRLAGRGSAAWCEQHRRAAHWFAGEGLAAEALDHAVTAADWETVRQVLADHWRRLRADGAGAALDAALDAMPAETLEQSPDLQLIAATRAFDRGDCERAEALLDRALVRRDRLSTRRRASFARDLALTRMERARALGDVDAGVAQAAVAGASLQGNTDHDLCSRALAHLELGRLRMASGHEDAETELRTAAELARAGAAASTAALANAERALAHALDGRIGEATLVLGAVPEPTGAAADLARAAVAAEAGDLSFAAAALARAREAAEDCRLRAVQLAVVHARIASRGDAATAADALETLRAVTAGWRLPARCESLATTACIRLATVLAQADALPVGPDDHGVAVATALALLARGDASAALREAAAVTAGAGVPTLAMGGALAVAAAASDAEGDRPEAARLAERALEHAEPDGLRLALADPAPAIEPVLVHLLRFGTAHRSLVGEVQELMRSGATDVAGSPRPLREELSARELAVLRYLPTMLTSQEIAGELFVSLNTVKSHLKNIYRKLEADGRRHAVRRARELGLIAPGGLTMTRR